MASQVVGEVESAVGRVPMWGWLALGGGAFAIVMIRHNAANAANAAASTVDTGALPGQVYGGGGSAVTPGTTPDPGFQPPVTTLPSPQSPITDPTPQPTYNQKITDIWGGTLSQLIGGLTNQPDYVNLQTGADGSTNFTETNTITAGGGNGVPLYYPDQTRAAGEAAANLATANAQGQASIWQAWAAAMQAYFAGLNSGNGGDSTKPPLTPPITPPAPPVTPPQPTAPAQSCNSGNYSCIKGYCAPHDVTCAHRVAPWWRGDAIGGWS